MLDLGFFNSVQALQQEERATPIDELLSIVMNAFANLSREKLEFILLTLMKVMECFINCDSDNSFKMPHMYKERNKRRGVTISHVCCSREALQKADEFWRNGIWVVRMSGTESGRHDYLKTLSVVSLMKIQKSMSRSIMV